MCKPKWLSHYIDITPYLAFTCELICGTDMCYRNKQCNRTDCIWSTVCFNLCPNCQLFPWPIPWLAWLKTPSAGSFQWSHYGSLFEIVCLSLYGFSILFWVCVCGGVVCKDGFTTQQGFNIYFYFLIFKVGKWILHFFSQIQKHLLLFFYISR